MIHQIVEDHRPRCGSHLPTPDGNDVPCDLHQGHEGQHEWSTPHTAFPTSVTWNDQAVRPDVQGATRGALSATETARHGSTQPNPRTNPGTGESTTDSHAGGLSPRCAGCGNTHVQCITQRRLVDELEVTRRLLDERRRDADALFDELQRARAFARDVLAMGEDADHVHDIRDAANRHLGGDTT